MMEIHRRADSGAEASIASLRVATNMPAVADDDLAADVDEPPDRRARPPRRTPPVFCRSPIPTQVARQPSLLTKALLHSPEPDRNPPDLGVLRGPVRRRSINSNASLASTAELTSDGGFTSPARSNTPSPPLPANAYSSIPPLSLAQKAATPAVEVGTTEPLIAGFHNALGLSAKADGAVDAPPKKRCITFACGGRKDLTATPELSQSSSPHVTTTIQAPKRPCALKFACPAKPAASPSISGSWKDVAPSDMVPASLCRSPSKKLRSPASPGRSRREPASPAKPYSLCSLRPKPKYIIADEEALQSCSASRFHEFASEEVRDDDWIRKDEDDPKAKITIKDTLKVENAIRKLGDEAEEEAQADDEEEEELEAGVSANDDDDEFSEDDPADDTGDEYSDGNETDDEEGFAESDEESDPEGHYEFWTPVQAKFNSHAGYRPSAHRKASTSSIDSNHQSSSIRAEVDMGATGRRNPIINIRHDTPELPDSTDFVCGTLDEDRPLEEAYASCLEARKHANRRVLPQDIDPSFPASEPEDEDAESKAVENTRDSDEHVWLGKFEESDEGRQGHRRSPMESPKRMGSPPPKRYHSPPPKSRLRSPAPRKLFGQSPKCTRSPTSRPIHSPAPSVTDSPRHLQTRAVGFAPLGSRPGLTHTKSLPRTPAVFCRQTSAARLEMHKQPPKHADGHVRGAMDIVKGLERKRQYRREKYYRSRRCQQKKKPQPGKGAERMRELGLVMAGKAGAQTSYMLSL